MQELFARTLSQGLQAFLPAAVCLVWFRCCRRADLLAATRLGLLAAIPLTAITGWLFQISAYQARWESLMAASATGLALACGMSVWRRISISGASSYHRRRMLWKAAVAAAAALIVVRQTMLMAAVLGAAAIQMRSFDATAVVVGAAALALGAAGGWVFVGNRLPQREVLSATSTFAVLFLAQAAFYAVHKSAEARFLPWGELLDVATESYGPDSVFGRYVSDLLVALPVTAAVLSTMGDHDRRARNWHLPFVWVRRFALAAIGIIVAVSIVLTGTKALVVTTPRVSDATVAAPAIELTSVATAPHVVFLSKRIDTDYTALSVAPLQAPGAGRVPSGLRCERVSFAAGRGICLQANRGVFTTYQAVLFNDQFQPSASFKLEGSPSRTRISADGRVGAVTIFVSGQAHGYLSPVFSTKTMLLDMASGEMLGDLEQFSTWRDGKRFSAADFNFWGVTFARDGNTFYASLRTAADSQPHPGEVTRRSKTFLVQGDLGLRKLTVLHENVECPSLSPNNRLIAYKKRVGPDMAPWRFYVLELATMTERPIEAETRYIDDQVEWFDDAHVLYGAKPSSRSAVVDVYMASIEGSEPAHVFLPAAESPIVVR
jgi:hypothetical protein